MPKYELETSTKFEKQYKKLSQKDKENTNQFLAKLLNDEPLEPKHRDHALKGVYKDFRECHIKPDLLLVYKKEKETLLLLCIRIGSHSEIFK